jgi:plastocyanin
MRQARLVATLMVTCGSIACGGGSSTSPSPPPQPNPYTITISSGGVAAPKELTVPQGARVLFVNNDSRRHDLASDEHPDHRECPELNINPLNPGQSRESGNLNIVRTCGYHDHDNPNDRNLQGSIVIR